MKKDKLTFYNAFLHIMQVEKLEIITMMMWTPPWIASSLIYRSEQCLMMLLSWWACLAASKPLKQCRQCEEDLCRADLLQDSSCESGRAASGRH